jgi:hypothetical protein
MASSFKDRFFTLNFPKQISEDSEGMVKGGSLSVHKPRLAWEPRGDGSRLLKGTRAMRLRIPG